MASHQHMSPYETQVASKTTRFETTGGPVPPRPCFLLLRVQCSARFSSEFHFTGGGVERRDERCRGPAPAAAEEDGVVLFFDVETSLRSEAACHAALRGDLARRLPQLAEFCREAELWDGFVPPGLVDGILTAVSSSASGEAIPSTGSSSGGSCRCDVWMRVDVTRVYSEAKALALACAAADGRDDAVGGGEEQCCLICMEELLLAADGDGDAVTDLPGCSHAFHWGCILEWFHAAPTCPSCRRDITHYLPPPHTFGQC